ncbi:MAG: ATP-binding cassette domain-containing protein [Spirochaetaceae bacterium]|nr:ATP-binding cassette domain-containing protein [Spirochaetaceae bacterium]
MGWFQELINVRVLNDEESLSAAFADLVAPIMGEKAVDRILRANTSRTQGLPHVRGAIGEILDFFHAEAVDAPEAIEAIPDLLDYMLRPSGLQKRRVELRRNWYRDGIGPLLAECNGKVLALIPCGFSAYRYTDELTGRKLRVTKSRAAAIGREAFCFYKPLPRRPLAPRDLIRHIIRSLSAWDVLLFVFVELVLTLFGMVVPATTNLIFTHIVLSDERRLLLAVLGTLSGVSLSSFLVMICRSFLIERMKVKIKLSLQSALMERLLSLPALFFKKFSAGESAERLNGSAALTTFFTDFVFGGLLSLAFSVGYFIQIFSYGRQLLLPALGAFVAAQLFSIITALFKNRTLAEQLKAAAQTSGFVFQLINGIQKIKLVGAENRAFAQWAKRYRRVAKTTFAPPFIFKTSAVISSCITLAGTLAVYYIAGRSQMTAGSFLAFSVAYGMITPLSIDTLVNVRPVLEQLKPFLETAPEISGDKYIPLSLSGALELNHVSFRYDDKTPMIIDNLSLKINKGEYVALVGKTGCGKSTLLRLLLGFEKPLFGSIYYDSKDLEKLDMKSVRKLIGTVMQNSKLGQGSIYENIVVSAPHLTLDDAWAAAEMAGFAEDIRAMPMGMFTMVSEGGGGFSGGQKQRLVIARALAAKPRLLLFDEATSALDNITQQHVAEALGRLKCTRLVIAHRLSTIRRCDRILVLEQGRIAEDGAYDDLIKRGGLFVDLVARQRLPEIL